MRSVLTITSLRFTPADASVQPAGLLGYVRLTLNGRLMVDGITVLRTRTGVLAVSFPSRVDRDGQLHPVLRPVGCGTRAEFEAQILDALRLEGHFS